MQRSRGRPPFRLGPYYDFLFDKTSIASDAFFRPKAIPPEFLISFPMTPPGDSGMSGSNHASDESILCPGSRSRESIIHTERFGQISSNKVSV